MSNDKTPEERLRDSLNEYIAAKASGRKFRVELLLPDGWALVHNPRWEIECEYRIVYEPRTIWVNDYADGGLGYAHGTLEEAKKDSAGHSYYVRTVKFVEDFDAD